MSQQRKMMRRSKVSKREEERITARRKKSDENIATKISRIGILIVLIAMVVALAYTVVLLAGN